MDATSTPSIRVSQHHRYPSPETERRSPPYLSRSPASPMSIPNVSTDAPVPPPLPPPQHPELDDDVGIGHHKGWDWFNKEYVNQHWTDFGKTQSVKPGSNLLGGKKAGPGVEGEDNAHDNEIDPARRGSSISTITAAHQGTESMNETTTVSSDKEEGSSGSKPSSYRCVFMLSLSMQPFIIFHLRRLRKQNQLEANSGHCQHASAVLIGAFVDQFNL